MSQAPIKPEKSWGKCVNCKYMRMWEDIPYTQTLSRKDYDKQDSFCTHFIVKWGQRVVDADYISEPEQESCKEWDV